MPKGDRKNHIRPFRKGVKREIKKHNEVIAAVNDYGDRIFDLEGGKQSLNVIVVEDGVLRNATVNGASGDEVTG